MKNVSTISSESFELLIKLLNDGDFSILALELLENSLNDLDLLRLFGGVFEEFGVESKCVGLIAIGVDAERSSGCGLTMFDGLVGIALSIKGKLLGSLFVKSRLVVLFEECVLSVDNNLFTSSDFILGKVTFGLMLFLAK